MIVSGQDFYKRPQYVWLHTYVLLIYQLLVYTTLCLLPVCMFVYLYNSLSLYTFTFHITTRLLYVCLSSRIWMTRIISMLYIIIAIITYWKCVSKLAWKYIRIAT